MAVKCQCDLKFKVHFRPTRKYTLRRKGSIQNLKWFYQRYVFGTPKRFYTEAFLRVL